MIRAAVGLSTSANTATAALSAVAEAVSGLDGKNADFCIAFATAEHGPALAEMQETLSTALGTPYVVGCSAAGVLTANAEHEDGPALGILAVASDQVRATPFLFRDEGDLGLTAGVRLGQRLVCSRDSDDVVLVWPDPQNVRPDRLLSSLDAVLGSVPVVGAAAAARGGGTRTFQFCGRESCSAAVSGLRLGGRFRHVVAVTQGCRPLRHDPLRVTGAHGNLILELEGRPPLELLRQCAPEGLLDRLEWGLHFLFVALLPEQGAARVRPGEYLVRNIVAADPDTGVLVVAGEVEEGQSLVFACRDGESARQDLVRVVRGLDGAGDRGRYRFGLYFNCLARGRSLYDEIGTDSRILAEALPGVPLLGFFCNAEIGPLGGRNRLFTYTGVLLLVSE